MIDPAGIVTAQRFPVSLALTPRVACSNLNRLPVNTWQTLFLLEGKDRCKTRRVRIEHQRIGQKK
jgi:hypothetical protein